MKIYLSARYERRQELRLYRDRLIKSGHEVISSWLDTDDFKGAVDIEKWRECANLERAEINQCDTMIIFSEPYLSAYPMGSRHVELGIALERNMVIIICGPVENIFMALRDVCVIKNFEVILAFMEKMK